MTTSDLICYLRRIDPEGDMTVINDNEEVITMIRTISGKVKISNDDCIIKNYFPWLFEKE